MSQASPHPSVLLDKTGLMRLSSQRQFGKGWSIFQGKLSPKSLGDRRALQGLGSAEQTPPSTGPDQPFPGRKSSEGHKTGRMVYLPCPTDVENVPLGTGSPGQFLGHSCRPGVRRQFLLSEPDRTSQVSASLSVKWGQQSLSLNATSVSCQMYRIFGLTHIPSPKQV